MKEILKMSIAPGALAVACYFVLQNIPLDSVLKLALGILCYLVVYLPLFYVFSMNACEKELLSKPLKKFKKNSTQAKSILGKRENI